MVSPTSKRTVCLGQIFSCFLHLGAGGENDYRPIRGLQVSLKPKIRIPDTICPRYHHKSDLGNYHRLGEVGQNTYLKTVCMGSRYTPKKYGISVMWDFGLVGFPLMCIEDTGRLETVSLANVVGKPPSFSDLAVW